jgi:hypothetical protein
MDYAALAKQYGGSTAAPAVDYAALAKQFGGSTANLPETGPRKTGTIVDQIPGYGGPVPAAQPQQLSAGQKVYQAARPFVAPLAEAAGAIGGGILGTSLGPMGTVGGAGLGYGMAKEGLEIADVAMGMKAPRQGALQVVEPVRNIIEGSTMEMGGQALAKGLGYVGGKVVDMRQMPQQRAARIAKAALGDDLPTVLNALRNAPANANVAELTASIQNPTWQALIKDSLQKDPQFLRKMRLMDEAESVNALSRLAGGVTATETRATNELAKSNLNTITSPMRETALARANLGKFVADDAALRQANDLAVLTGSGSKIDPAQFVAQATGAEKALRSVGIKPLEGAPLADKIVGISKNPSFAENDLIQGSVQQVSDGIRRWTSSGGVIDANALEAIRKNAVNAAIAKLRPGADATAQRNLAAGVMSKIKPMIDNAIEGAGGAGWRDYLTTHAKGMQQIAEKKLTGEALNLFKTNKDAFVKLVQGESPEAVEKILGPGSYNIAKEVSENTLAVMEAQARKHLTQLSVKEQATEGQKALSELVAQQTSSIRFPSFLTFWTTAGNKVLGELEQRVGAKTMKILTEAAKTPKNAENLLNTLPASERNRVLQLLSNPQRLTPGSAGATLNMLSPQSENQNALVK